VPRATLVAILLVVLLYLGLQIVGQGVLGATLGSSGVPVADTAGALWSPGRVLLLVTACVSMLGFLMGNLLGTSRLVFALGRDGYLPRAFGTVSARHRVPLLALVTHAGLAWALALVGNFDTLALISGGAICLATAGELAAWRAQRRDRGTRRTVRVAGRRLIPLFAVAAMVLIVTTPTTREWRSASRWRFWWRCTRCWRRIAGALTARGVRIGFVARHLSRWRTDPLPRRSR
jgi:APA family basic amino acid/polyamine antiporter